MICPSCRGAAIVFTKAGPQPCARCAGAGEVSEPAAAKPRKYKLTLVDEFWGAEETNTGLHFAGSAGRELNKILEEAEIDRRDCYVTTALPVQPSPTLDLKNLCVPKNASSVPMPPIQKGAYLADEHYPKLREFWEELYSEPTNVIVTLGQGALWALTGNASVRALRGAVTQVACRDTRINGRKVLPTYSVRNLFKNWPSRPLIVADLMKAKRQAEFPEIRRPKRELWLEPSLNHIELFYENYIKRGATVLSADIETAGATQITCIGFAPSPDRAIVIPFVDSRKRDGSYWRTPEEEVAAWQLVRKYLRHIENPTLEILGQNFLYDMNWLWTKLGITPVNFRRDTMLKHHAINPELEKGLGFLGSIYTDEPAWKTMRGKGLFTIKRGE